MTFKDNIKSDLDSVFFSDEFAETVEYAQDGNLFPVSAIILERSLDENETIDIESQAEILIRESELNDWGIEPKPHDLINNKWEVEQRSLNFGVYKLFCYASVRSRM